MKMILLMSCGLCLAGSQGWTMDMGDGVKRSASPTEDPALSKRARTEKNSPISVVSEIKTTEGTSRLGSEGSALEEAAEDLRQRILDDETYKAHCDMVREVSGRLEDLLNSEEKLDGISLKFIENAAENYQKKLDFIKDYSKKETKKIDKTPTKMNWNYARSEVFYYIIDDMSDVIWDEGEGSLRGIRAKAIQDFLDPPCPSESEGLEEIEE